MNINKDELMKQYLKKLCAIYLEISGEVGYLPFLADLHVDLENFLLQHIPAIPPKVLVYDYFYGEKNV